MLCLSAKLAAVRVYTPKIYVPRLCPRNIKSLRRERIVKPQKPARHRIRTLRALPTLLRLGIRAERGGHGAQQRPLIEVSERRRVSVPICFVGEHPQRGRVMSERVGGVLYLAHRLRYEQRARHDRRASARVRCPVVVGHL